MVVRKTSSSSSRKSSTRSRAAQMKTLTEDMTGLVIAGQSEQAVQTLLDLVGSISADIERISSLNSRYAALLFGRRSERLTREELGQLALSFGATQEEAQSQNVQIPVPSPDASLCDEAASEEDAPKNKTRKKRPNHPGRTRLAADLRREVSTTKVNEDERACMHCDAPMSLIGYQKHERIEYVPAQIVVHEEHREKLVCKGCRGDATTAPRTQAPAVIGRGGASVLAHLIESKCDDCQPIHRQADQFSRLGWEVPSNTLYGYWKHGTELLGPVAQATESVVLGGYVVGIDDTRLDFLDECNGGRKKRGHLWCFANKGGMASYAFTKSWDAQEIAPWIAAAANFVQVDDYKGYACEVKTPEGNRVHLVDECKRLGCGMHIRRRYHAAFKVGDLRAALPLSYFKRLYEIEEKIRGLPQGRVSRFATSNRSRFCRNSMRGSKSTNTAFGQLRCSGRRAPIIASSCPTSSGASPTGVSKSTTGTASAAYAASRWVGETGSSQAPAPAVPDSPPGTPSCSPADASGC